MKATGWILLIVGVVGLIVVYTYRPPSGIGQAFLRLTQGQNFFFKEPLYEILLGLFGIVSILGIVNVVKSKR